MNMQTASEQRPYAVFDIDGTIVRWQLFHALCRIEFARAGKVDESTYTTSLHGTCKAWRERSYEEASSMSYEKALLTAYAKQVFSPYPLES